MKTFFRIIFLSLLICTTIIGCKEKTDPSAPTPVPPEGYVRQSYDIHGLTFEDGCARVYGLVLNTGTLDIAYIGFTVELCDRQNNVLYEKRYETVLYDVIIPGDCFPFNCIFENVFDEDIAIIASVRIGDFVWTP